MMEMKSWPQYFQPMIDGFKTTDIRSKVDRHFHIGQRVLLREYEPFGYRVTTQPAGYTGRKAEFEVTHIISNDTPCALSSAVLHRDYCALSLRFIGMVS